MVFSQNYVGPIIVKEDGNNVVRYVMAGNPKGINIVDNTTIIMEHGVGFSMAKSQSNIYAPYIWTEYRLINKTLSFTTDLSEIDCSCNANIYLVTMPGYNSSGQPDPGQRNDYHCGANYGNNGKGAYCWEMDLIEANKYALQVTPHKCSSPPGQYDASCDGAGCGTKTYNKHNRLCPNSTCIINTQQSFRQSVSFNGSSIHIELIQDNRTIEYDVCGNTSYIETMNEAFSYGMTLVGSYWGGDYNTMKWLDGVTGCTGNCSGIGKAKFSDIEISPIDAR